VREGEYLDEYIRVEDVIPELQLGRLFTTRIICRLEDGRYFFLERVPFDIVISLKKLRGEEVEDDRERLVDILVSMPEVLDLLGRHLRRVIINELDPETEVYSAVVEFTDGEMTLRRKMVPSHAIFLAILTNKPIYVRKTLVDQQEELMKLDLEDISDEDEYEFDYDEDFDDFMEKEF